MKLQEIFDALTMGELRQLSLGGYEDGMAISPDKYEEVVSHINMALMKLYGRFPILEKEVKLETRSDRYIYPLMTKYAQSSGNPDWFIDDQEDAFTQDVLGIVSVFSNNEELPINNETKEYSVFTTAYNTLQIPFATGFEELAIIYKAAPAKVLPDPEVEVLLPDVLLEPLLAYVEYRVRKAMGSAESVGMAQAALQVYEMLCTEVEKHNLFGNSDNSDWCKFKLRGWV